MTIREIMNGRAISAIDEWAVLTYGAEHFGLTFWIGVDQ